MILRLSLKRVHRAFLTTGSRVLRTRLSGKWLWSGRSHSRSTLNTAPCPWFGMYRHCHLFRTQLKPAEFRLKMTCQMFVHYVFLCGIWLICSQLGARNPWYLHLSVCSPCDPLCALKQLMV